MLELSLSEGSKSSVQASEASVALCLLVHSFMQERGANLSEAISMRAKSLLQIKVK